MSEKSLQPKLRFKDYSLPWESRRLGDFCNIFAGGTPSTSIDQYWKDGDVNWLPSGNIQDCVIKEEDIVTKITKKGLDNSAAKLIKKDTALLAMTGATCGKTAYLTCVSSANQSVMAFETEKLNSKLLYFIFQKNKDFILKYQAGGAQAGINKETCTNFEFLFPNKEEQDKIAELFTNVESLIDSNQRKLDKIVLLRRSLLEKMFPSEGKNMPEIRFNSFNEEWHIQRLDNFVSYFSGLTYSPSDITDEGTLVLRSSNVKNGEIIDADNVYVLPSAVDSENVLNGDIVMVVRNGSRALIGKHAVIKENMPNTVIGAFMTGIRSEYPSFVSALLETPHFEKEINENMGATINQITGYMFSKMSFMIPENKNEQEKIGNCFRKLDDLMSLYKDKLVLLKNLKSSLLEKVLA